MRAGMGRPGTLKFLDSTKTSKWSVSMVLDKNDTPHIVYTDIQAHLIKYVTKRAGKWEFQAVRLYCPARLSGP